MIDENLTPDQPLHIKLKKYIIKRKYIYRESIIIHLLTFIVYILTSISNKLKF